MFQFETQSGRRMTVLVALIATFALASQAGAQTEQSVELALEPQPEAAPAKPINPATAITDGAKALMAGQPTQAVANYTVALATDTLTREKRAILLNDRGVALWRDGQGAQAITDFNKAVSLYPEYAAIYNNRGTVLLGLGLVDEAVRDFDRAILLGPRYATAYSNRAAAHMRKQAHERALDDYTKAASLQPGDAVAFLGRGRTHLLANRPYAAERDFTKGISLAPKLVELYEQRRTARLAIGRRDGAFQDLDQTVVLRSDSPDAFIRRGKAYLDRNQKKLALRDFDTAIALDPTRVEAHVGRARVMLLYRGIAKAREAIDAALAIQMDAPDALAVRGAIIVAEGDPERGLAEIKAVLGKHTKNVAGFLMKGAVLEKIDNRDNAIIAFRSAAILDPENLTAKRALKRLKAESQPQSTRIIAGAGLDGWRVHVSGKDRYFATHEKYARLEVPLEVYGKSRPRILDWEQKTGAFKGIGLLRYTAGKRRVKGRAVTVEQAAIVDLNARVVQGLEPVRIGDKAALWNWEKGTLTVRGVDGLVNTFGLRRAIARRKTTTRRRQARKSDWLADPWGIQGESTRTRAQKRRTKRRAPKRRKKKKTLFDLIFQ